MGVSVQTRVLFDNITTRFLLFQIPTTTPLEDLAHEFETSNGLYILELRRFIKRGTNPAFSPVLITLLGTSLPEEIRLWFSIHRMRQFIDRPLQYRKCHKFTRCEVKCNIENKICVTCGESSNKGACSSPIKCANRKGAYTADFNQCPVRVTEINFLNFKCKQHLTFTEARRCYSQKEKSNSYAKTASVSLTQTDDIQKHFDQRTSNMVQILNRLAMKVTKIKHYIQILES